MLVSQVLASAFALAALAGAAPAAAPDADTRLLPRLPDRFWCSKKQIEYCKNLCPSIGMDYHSCYWLGSCNCKPRGGGGGGCRRGNVIC